MSRRIPRVKSAAGVVVPSIPAAPRGVHLCISIPGVHLNYGWVERGSFVQSSSRDLIAGVKFFALTGPTEISPGQARRRAPPWVNATPRMSALKGLRNADTSLALSGHTHSLNPRSQGGARRASLPWAGFLRPFGANTTTPAIRSGHRIGELAVVRNSVPVIVTRPILRFEHPIPCLCSRTAIYERELNPCEHSSIRRTSPHHDRPTGLY